MSDKPSINPTYRTLAAGQTVEVPSGGAEIFIRKVEGASEIEIALDNGEFLPVAAGEGFAATHGIFKLHNPNATTVQVTVLQSTIAGVYIDRRDTATSVSIGGSFAVVNSPSIDNGGAVNQLSQSLVVKAIDLTGLPDANTTLISAAMNLTGVRVRELQITYFTITANNTRWINFGNPVRSKCAEYLKTTDAPKTLNYPLNIDLPAGGEMIIKNRGGDVLSLTVEYDNL